MLSGLPSHMNRKYTYTHLYLHLQRKALQRITILASKRICSLHHIYMCRVHINLYIYAMHIPNTYTEFNLLPKLSHRILSNTHTCLQTPQTFLHRLNLVHIVIYSIYIKLKYNEILSAHPFSSLRATYLVTSVTR